jgi:hypothetical protein
MAKSAATVTVVGAQLAVPLKPLTGDDEDDRKPRSPLRAVFNPLGPELSKSLFAKEGFQGVADAGSRTPRACPFLSFPRRRESRYSAHRAWRNPPSGSLLYVIVLLPLLPE